MYAIRSYYGMLPQCLLKRCRQALLQILRQSAAQEETERFLQQLPLICRAKLRNFRLSYNFV